MRLGAWSIAAATAALIAAASVMLATDPEARVVTTSGTNSLLLLAPLMFVSMGVLVLHRLGSHMVGWLFCISGCTWAVYHLSISYGGAVVAGASLPAQDVVIWTSAWTPFLAFGLSPVLVMFVFPSGHLPRHGWRRWFAFTAVVVVIGAIGHAFVPGPLEDIPAIHNPYGVPGVIGRGMAIIRDAAWPLLIVASVGGIVALRRRALAGTYDERQQIKWMILAAVSLAIFGVVWGVLEFLGQPQGAAAAAGLFLPLVPLALGIAILKHRLYDIDVLINRTLVYASLSAVLAGIYLVAVVLFQRVLSPITAESNIAIAASTLAVAALFRPLRARIQAFIDRRFYREKYSAIATLELFSTRLRNELDIDALETELLVVIEQTLHPQTATVWLKASDS